MDRACGYGPQGWGFDSLRARRAEFVGIGQSFEVTNPAFRLELTIIDAVMIATAAPVAASAPHTTSEPVCHPTTRHATDSRQRVAVMSAALTHHRLTRQR